MRDTHLVTKGYKTMPDLEHLFEQIVAGEIPSYKVYENDNILAFLDIYPASFGHTLVIPKKRYEFLHEVPAEIAADIGRVLPQLARAVIEVTGAAAYNIIANNGVPAGQVVPHVHFHIIPKFTKDDGLIHKWNSVSLADDDAIKLRNAIQAAISS